MPIRRFCTVLLLSLLCAAGTRAEQVRWQSVELGGSKIGYRQLSREISDERVLTTERLVITLQQPGEAPRTSTIILRYQESLDGKPLSLSKVVSSQATEQRITAKVSGDTLRVERSDGRQTETREVAVSEDFLLPEGIRRALRQAGGEQRQVRFTTFNLSTLSFEPVVLRGERQSGELPWVFSYRQGASENATRWFTNNAFEVLREESVSGGEALVLYDCGERCALAPFSPTTHVYRRLIRAPVRMPEAALRGQIRYQLAGELALIPPITAEQNVRRDENGWLLDICTGCGSEAAPDSALLERALQPTYWIAAGDPEIKRLAAEHGAADEPAAAMSQLTRFVSLHMGAQPDYAGFATASEALASGKGDCTEHALLLAALARAAGYPARIAIGLAYNTERFLGRKYVFVPHAWVQVWDGRGWRSFDSGLGEFHSGYIALALSYSGEISDFTRINAQLHALKIVAAARVQSREGAP